MRPERIRENLAGVEARQREVELEAGILAEVAEGLRRLLALTEQPGQSVPKEPAPRDRGGQADGGSIARTPAPAPPRGRKGSTVSEDPQGTDAGRGVRLPAASTTTVVCQECGREVKRQGLGIHLSKAHGIPGQAVKSKRREPALAGGRGQAPPTLPGSPIHPEPAQVNGKETFLCSRCPESFPTRDAWTAHMRRGHPPDPGSGLRPVGRDPLAQQGGATTAVKLA